MKQVDESIMPYPVPWNIVRMLYEYRTGDRLGNRRTQDIGLEAMAKLRRSEIGIQVVIDLAAERMEKA